MREKYVNIKPIYQQDTDEYRNCVGLKEGKQFYILKEISAPFAIIQTNTKV
jgi:hypothetical protein